MKILFQILFIMVSIFWFGCIEETTSDASYQIPKRSHDLSYITYNKEIDISNYIICDSTDISSGRNRLTYIGGISQLEEDINSMYLLKKEYESFNGYIMIRFLVNCEGKLGRYRAEALASDFSRTKAPSGLLNQCIELIKKLEDWKKSSNYDSNKEYSKFINLKFNNGKIEYVLL